MAQSVKFEGCNFTYRPPEGVEEDQCSSLSVFKNGACVVSAWQFTPEELAEINRTGRAFLSVWTTGPYYPTFVGSESAAHGLVADFGAVWKLSESKTRRLYAYAHNESMGGYVVYRSHTFATRDEFEPSRFYLENKKHAIFRSEKEAKEYCDWRNATVERNGRQDVPPMGD